MTESRRFALADILSVTTGKLLSHRHIEGVYDILGYMTGESLMTHQLPRAAEACRPSLIAQHPDLDGLDPSPDLDRDNLYSWLLDAERQYGQERPVSPAPAGNWQHKDALTELVDMVGADKVIPVTVKD
jgi:hypothetical protein